MNWVKKNYDQFTLALLSLILLAVAVLLILRTTAFPERFTSALAHVNPNNTIPAVDTAVIDQAKKEFADPKAWTVAPMQGDGSKNGGLLFTAKRHVVGDDGELKPIAGVVVQHSRIPVEMPGQWFLDYGLSPIDPNIGTTDTDGDGFLNEDEYVFKTDPLKADSHPEYHNILFLTEWVRVPFRLKFQAYDGNPKTGNPEDFSFQINTLDLRQPSEFLKLGETVANTDFKLTKFEFKEALNEATGVMEDVSELSVVNQKTQESVVLIYDKVADSPNQFAKFGYILKKEGVSDGKTPFEFTVPKLGEFVLRPEVTKRYKLLDVNAGQAKIQTPDGKEYVVKKSNVAPANP
ncbi:MAG: Amuc_1099 family pilus-like system protein [Chthoniobacteraceae bacterium]